MFDPEKIAAVARAVVCVGDERKYYRFRPARFYGGIATADCLGCNLRCLFCWSWDKVASPERFGKLYSPEEVAKNLLSIARKKNFRRLRISGNEPTLCKEHLLRVLELIPGEYIFILETNGILIGRDPDYATELSRFDNLHVRLSLKGASAEEFSKLTGAVPRGFELQIRALERLVECGVDAHPACMVSFSSSGNIAALRERLRRIHPAFEDFEAEEFLPYGRSGERVRKLVENI